MKEMFGKGFGFVMGIYVACKGVEIMEAYFESLKDKKETNKTEQEDAQKQAPFCFCEVISMSIIIAVGKCVKGKVIFTKIKELKQDETRLVVYDAAAKTF